MYRLPGYLLYPYKTQYCNNKLNNCVNNLEWCDNDYNYNHALVNGLVRHRNRPVALLENNIEIMRFPSLIMAIRETRNKGFGSVSYCLYGKNKGCKKTINKYKWVLI